MDSLKGAAVKLYVFIDSPMYRSPRPHMVIINRFKTIADLRKEFSENQNYISDEQYWVINNSCWLDENEIAEVIDGATPIERGYVAYLYMISKEDKNKIPEFIDTFLERQYSNLDPYERWNEPHDDPIIIADVINRNEPLPIIGWTCDSCTFVNKHYQEWCDVCGSSRPADYEAPKHFILSQEDNLRIKKLKEDKEKENKREEERLQQMEREKLEYRKKLEEMYKKQVAYTTEVSECPICVMEYEPGEAVILHSCHHTVCKDCLKGYLTTIDDPKVKCPTENCVGILEDGEISEILTEEEYKKYEQLNLRTAESKTANTFHCKTPNCTAWVVYDDNVNFFDCPLCMSQNCLLCAAIHKDQTCKEYQEEMAIKARNDLAAQKDLEFLENMIKTGEAMKCPGCKIIVQKKSGCDWMKCNMCKTEICWATKGPRWGPKGPGDTTGGCKCNYVLKRCHPKCGNCH